MGETLHVLDDQVDTRRETPPFPPSPPALHLASLSEHLSRIFAQVPSPGPLWSRAAYGALFVLVVVWAALLYTTWATWGNVTIDSGHEMYVPTVLAQGKMLYRDVWFMYGPAAPYFNAGLFRIFGAHLSVLYWAGSLAALGSAIFLYLTGLSLGSWLIGWTAGVVVLIQAFAPGLFCFPLPYSFSAVYGCLTACAFLWLSIRGIQSGRWAWILGAGTVAAVALLLKLEFGVACYCTLVLLIAADSFRHRSWRPVGRGLAAFLPGLLVCAAIGSWMVSIAGADFITQDNFMSWPTSYFMKAYGKLWLAGTGFDLSTQAFIEASRRVCILGATLIGLHLLLRREPVDGSWAFFFAGFCLAILGSITFVVILPALTFLSEHPALADLVSVALLAGALASVHLLRRRSRANIGFIFAVAGLGAAALACLAPISVLQIVFWLRRVFFPQDMVLIVGLGALACWCYAFRRVYSSGTLALALLFTFPTLLTFRVLMGMQAQGYPIFYNGTAILAFLFLASRLIVPEPGSRRTIDFRAELVVCCCCLAWTVTQNPVFVDRYKNLAPLATERGVIWVSKGMVPKYQAAITFMKKKAAAGQSVLSVPEDTSLYFFSGTVSPTRVFQFTPGVLVPGKMTQNVISEMERKQVRYLLWSNRTSEEYGVRLFGKDYDTLFAGYLTSHYRRVAPLLKNDEPGWSAVVWERISD